MDSEKKVQAEDKPVTKEPEYKNPAEAITPAPKKRLADRALPWVITGLVCILTGAIATFFVFYQPKTQELKDVKADLATANQNATQLQAQLDKANADLTAAQATLVEQTKTLSTSDKFRLIYKFQADVNAAQASLTNHEPTSAKQALGYASDDLLELGKTDLDQSTLAGFKAKIDQANTSLTSTPDSAITTLQLLQSDVLNMISHLK
jgi:FtsZ-binding cell division protein ZapB